MRNLHNVSSMPAPWNWLEKQQVDSFQMPIRLLAKFNRDVELAIRQIMQTWQRTGFNVMDAMIPQLNVTETDKDFHIQLEISDMDPKDLEISALNGVLTIQAKRAAHKAEREVKDAARFTTQAVSNFLQTLILPMNIDESKIEARLKENTLEIMIPKIKSEPRIIALNNAAHRKAA